MAENTTNQPAYNPASHTTSPPAAQSGSGNPASDAVTENAPIGTTLANLSHGIPNPDSVGTGTSSNVGAGGMGATGTRDLTDEDSEAASDILANTGTPGTGNASTLVTPTTGVSSGSMGIGNAGQTGGNNLSGGSNAGTA